MSTILVTHTDAIATITLNRSEAMNSLNDVMAKELLAAMTRVTAEPNTRIIILRGAGKMFMTGGDVKFFHEHLHTIEAKVAQVLDEVHQTVREMQAAKQIIIAAVHGAVAGIGVSLMLAADLVIAADDTKFTLAYSKIGATPDGGMTYTLPRIVGNKKAMELALLSDVFTAEAAKNYGLINWMVKTDELEQETLNIANHLALGPASAFANIKRLINQTWEHNFAEQLQAEKNCFIASVKTENFHRGVRAFVNREKVEFDND